MSDLCRGEAVYGGGRERLCDGGWWIGGSDARFWFWCWSNGAEVILAIKGGNGPA